MSNRLLTIAAMRRVDEAAIAGGVPGLTLMHHAGAAVAARARVNLPEGAREGGRVLILCGPGNNGGDGFVAARLLAADGIAIEIRLLGHRDALQGDAALAAGEWTGPVGDAARSDLSGFDLIVDALFGAGLSRDITGDPHRLIEAMAASGTPILAVDVPSGIDGDTGAVRGIAARAVETVTFVALKPGHLLQPGRSYCGALHVAEIGTGGAAFETGLAAAGAALHRNGPGLWLPVFPSLTAESHKYTRGHALVLSGPATRTGAARLAARAALRVGAGLVTMASPKDALAENAAHLTAIMLRTCEDSDDLDDLLTDERLNAIVLGPGLGIGERTRSLVQVAAEAGRGLVLDADALTSFKGQGDALAGALRDGGAAAVLTPHEGEFARVFGGTEAGEGAREGAGKLERARRAAALVGAVLVLKGSDTVIAAPDGRAAINDHASPALGTAGSGDVLAGLIAGLLAQSMPPFEAASAAVWMHGDAALRHGPGLIAEDLPEVMPAVLQGLVSG